MCTLENLASHAIQKFDSAGVPYEANEILQPKIVVSDQRSINEENWPNPVFTTDGTGVFGGGSVTVIKRHQDRPSSKCF